MIIEKPWGSYEVLYEDKNCKVKKIIVNPNQKLSYQSHKKRNELWTIIDGDGLIVINGLETKLSKGYYQYISANIKHRIIAGSEGVEFIEIQTGTYFGEDDIIRYEDEYGRV